MPALLSPAGVLIAFGLLALIPASPPQRDVSPAAGVPRIGYLGLRPMGEATTTIAALKDGLRELGQIEGRDYVLVIRLADNDPS